MSQIEYLRERIRGLETAKEAADSQELSDYLQRLIDDYQEQIRRLEVAS
jgi:hypothetical protein